MRHLRVVLASLISWVILAGASAQLATDAATFVLSVDRQGAYFSAADGTPLDEAAVVAQASAALSRDADTGVVVEAEEDAPYQSVVRAAALLQRAGAKAISFRTRTAD